MVEEEWHQSGVFSRADGGPTQIKRDGVAGVVTLERYHDGNVLHRIDGPAEIERDAMTGAVITTLLHKSADGRGSPFPGQTYPTVSVTGMPSAV